MSNAWSFETRQIHAGQEPDSATAENRRTSSTAR